MITVLTRYLARDALLDNPNPLTHCGNKIYSQNDEDGITFEILRRLGIKDGVFSEFGVGNGTENNTLSLVALGWTGFWVGSEDLAFTPNPDNVAELRFHYSKQWIKKDNIVDLYQTGLREIRQTHCDVISLDLDGNDYYFIDALLAAGADPSVFIVEYNAKFAPPIRFKIEYDDRHQWSGDDYFGVSLSTLVDLFDRYGYFLSCCNATGSNAFFVKSQYRELFNDIPENIESLYESPKYFITGLDASGHPSSRKTIEMLFRNLYK